MIKDYFILAFRNLRQRGLRTWLTMLGIFISIATIFILISLSLGLQGAVEEQFKLLGTDKFFVMPKTGMMGAPGTVGGIILTQNDVDIIDKTRGVKDYTYYTIGNAKVDFGGETKYLMIAGIPLENMQVYYESSTIKINEGELLKKGDSGKIMIGSRYKEGKIFKKQVIVGNKFTINEEYDLKVRGIAQPIGNPSDDANIYMSIEDFREIFNSGERVDTIVVQVQEGEDINEVADRVEKELRKEKGQTEKTQDFTISTPEDLFESFQTILNIITYFLAGIAGISLIVGAIGIANTMYTSVLERTGEIGVMKAIGARNSEIMWIFMIESGLLGFVGAGIGVLLGYGGSKLIEYVAVEVYGTTLLQVASPLYLIIGCLLFGFLIGAISGTLPAYQASKTSVVDALRYE